MKSEEEKERDKNKPTTLLGQRIAHQERQPNDLGERTKVWENEHTRYVSVAGLGTALYTDRIKKVKAKAAPIPLADLPLTALTVAQLKVQCKDRNLKVSGCKADLVDRINEWEHHCGIGGEEE